MKGYNGKILRINLTEAKYSVQEPSETYYQHYVGGRGIIIHTLLTEVPKGVDPLGPENKLIFSLGPLTGHPITGSGRNSVGGKSPLTGGYGESEAGGFWGAELKRSGFDAIIVEGTSSNPVFIWIDNGNVEIRDAHKMWGLEIADTVTAIHDELASNKIRTVTIGPGGENLVKFASIAHDITHMAARTGMGAVMGSKNLKAIAVRGSKAPAMADRESILQLSRWMGQNYKERAGVHRYGTGAAMVRYEETGNLPIRNFNGGRFPGAEKIAPQRMFEKGYIKKMDGCFVCPIRCKRRLRIEDTRYGAPEYETLAALGSNCGIDDLEAIIKANELCGRYGIDSISAGCCVSFAMECFEKGILTQKDTEGIMLSFGNAEAMIEMMKRIALREGFGDILAEGTKRAAQIIGKGSDQFAMHVKGEEIAMHEPRYKPAMALHYSVHATGADHVTGLHDDWMTSILKSWETFDVAESLPNTELSPRKARMLYHNGLWRQLVNTLGLCSFVPWSNSQVRDIMEAITGWPMSYWKLMKATERGITLARIFNLREGFSAQDDRLPDRFAISPSEGPIKGMSLDPIQFAEAQSIYYQMLGWDKSGIPTYARLVELDIEWAAQYLP